VATYADLAAAVANSAVGAPRAAALDDARLLRLLRFAAADTVVVTAGIEVSAQLVVARNLLVQGDAAQCAAAAAPAPAPVSGLCTLSGAGAQRIFQVYSASSAVTLELDSLALVQGSDAADGLGGGAVLLLPGASAAQSPSLIASECVFQANAATSTGPGGAIAANPSTLVSAPMSVNLSNVAFIGNMALAVAGAVFASGPTTLNNVSFAGNAAVFQPANLTDPALSSAGYDGLGFAGALALGSCSANGGSLSVTGGAFTQNSGTTGGAVVCGPACTCTLSGGVSFASNSAVGTVNLATGGNAVLGNAGAVAAMPGATLTVSDASFFNNTCSNNGGAIWLSGNKQGAINSALGGFFGFSNHSGLTSFMLGRSVAVTPAPASCSVTGSTFAQNSAVTSGGSVYIEGTASVLDVSSSTISSSSAATGGAIYAGAAYVRMCAQLSVADACVRADRSHVHCCERHYCNHQCQRSRDCWRRHRRRCARACSTTVCSHNRS
jgi:hypothetical protein